MIRIHRVWLLVIAFLTSFAVAPSSQPPAEGSMGRSGDPFEHAVRMSGEPSSSFLVEIKQHETFDFRGVQFFELRFAGGGSATVSVDADVPIAQVLRDAKGKQRLTLEAFALSQVAR